MKFILALLGVLMLIPTLGSAEELSFAWTPNTDPIDGYRILMNDQTNIVADNIPAADSEITLTAPLDGQCKNFWMRAYRGTQESGNSNVVVVCPAGFNPPLPDQRPNPVSGFSVNVSITQVSPPQE